MRFALYLILFFSFVSCAALGEKIKQLAGTSKKEPVAKEQVVPKNNFSQNKNFQASHVPTRKYGRMNRDRFVEEAQVGEDSGSLWVDEGQSSYLFSQNQKRLEGDVLNVLIEKQAREQLDSKIATIANLIKERKAAIKRKQMEKQNKQQAKAGDQAKEEQASSPAPSVAKAQEEAPENLPKLNADKIPSRVTSSYPDGSYRLKGTKTMLIENREFQVMVTGLVRGNDIKDDSVASSKLLDAKFDIVSQRRLR
tara:strand:- start:10175 stop:10930 length:756 start_codon:yes stop_codon:yes gene_type:complete